MSRKKSSLFEDLVTVVAMLPWWAGVALGVLSQLLLHQMAQAPVASIGPPGQMGAMVAATMWKSFATVGQYLLPIICFAGAGVSAWKQYERKGLVANVVQSKSAGVLDGMHWMQFEVLVGEAFRLQGYAVTETGGGGADGGVDLVLTKGGERFLVQCKQWKAFKVGVDVVRELYGVMAARGAAGGFVVTSGRFTDEAKAFASGRNVNLIDGDRLQGLIQHVHAAGRAGTGASAAATGPSPAPASSPAAAPGCPVCSKPMVRRQARRGANAGGEFWGCESYPACRGTRPAS